MQIAYIGDYSDAELETYLSTLQRIIRFPGRKVGLIDCCDATVATPSQRRRMADFITANEAILRRDFLACAIVLNNALLRGAVTAVFWLKPLPLPTEITGSVKEALAWLEPFRVECMRTSA
ncbi:MAG: hypothetical protein ABW252_14050 [Polyangiales bacterium]